jgi:hypothetical protein
MRRSRSSPVDLDGLLCEVCGKEWADKNHIGPREEEVGPRHHLRLAEADSRRLTDQQLDFLVRRNTKRFEQDGFDPPLPPPAERRRIRQAAGLAQIDVAGLLGVGEDLVYRWERPVGYDSNGRRLPGREPTGEARWGHAILLEMAERHGKGDRDEWHRQFGFGHP